MTLTFTQPPPQWELLSPAEKIEQVRIQVVTHGRSYGAAAEILGTSRHGIADAIERSTRTDNPIRSSSGLKNQNGVKKAKQKRPKLNHKARRPHQGLANLVPLEAPSEPYSVRTGAWVALEGSSPVEFWRLTNDQCKWSIGDSQPWLFCGLPTDGGPWCPGHKKIAFRPVKDARTG